MTAFRTLVFTVLVPGSVTVFVPYWILSAPAPGFANTLSLFRFLGVIPILLGVAIYLWCAWDFTFTGRGTPMPLDPPKELVVQGLYRWVRNPMYIGVASVVFGEAVLFQSIWLGLYLVLIVSAFHLFVVTYEEPALRRTFGETYERYCQSVPRWVPKMKRGG